MPPGAGSVPNARKIFFCSGSARVALRTCKVRPSLRLKVAVTIDRLVRGGELIEVERRSMDRAFVTDRAVWAERRILASMRDARGAGKALGDADAVEARLADSRLTEGQKEAVQTVLLSDDLVVGVQGHAGGGKTTMLREVKELLGGPRIQGLAPSAGAARVLGREAGIPTTTLQWFLTRYGDLLDPEQLDKARADYRGTVLAVDECSMIDTGRMRELLRIAERLGVARVALVGDTEQLRPVDAGQPFRLLQKAGMRTATMDEVLRQRDPALLASVMHARERAGVVEAARESGIVAFGSVNDMNREQDGRDDVATSALWDMSPAIGEAIRAVREGRFEAADYREWTT